MREEGPINRWTVDPGADRVSVRCSTAEEGSRAVINSQAKMDPVPMLIIRIIMIRCCLYWPFAFVTYLVLVNHFFFLSLFLQSNTQTLQSLSLLTTKWCLSIACHRVQTDCKHVWQQDPLSVTWYQQHGTSPKALKSSWGDCLFTPAGHEHQQPSHNPSTPFLGQGQKRKPELLGLLLSSLPEGCSSSSSSLANAFNTCLCTVGRDEQGLDRKAQRLTLCVAQGLVRICWLRLTQTVTKL